MTGLNSSVEKLVQWLSRWIHNPVLSDLKTGDGKNDSAFHTSEVDEMSISVINAAQMCQGCADRHCSLPPPPMNSFGKS